MRGVRVAGDKEGARQDRRARILSVLEVGMRVDTALYGLGIVQRVNRKTATVAFERLTCPVDLSWLTIIREGAPCPASE